MPRIVGVIQARMGSTRVPGKVMKTLAGRPVIWHIRDRLRRTPGVDEVILATSGDPRNDPMVAYAADLGMAVFTARDEDDIAARLAGAAAMADADAIVKINGDCPMADPEVMGLLVERYLAEPGVDYVSNKIVWTYPLGLTAELLGREALDWCDRMLSVPRDRELVADWIRDHPDRFTVRSLEHEEDLSNHRWTVDEPGDFEFVARVYNALYREAEIFGFRDVLDFLDQSRPGDAIRPTQNNHQDL